MAREIGDKLGPRLARLVLSHQVAARRALAPHEAKVSQAAAQALIDRAGREIAEHYRPIVRQLLDRDDGNLNPDVRAFLEDAISGTHQLKAVGGLLTGSVAGTIGTFLSNELAPLLYAAIRSNPNLQLDTGSLASMAAAGIMSDADAANRASEQGINNSQFEDLQELARQYPGVSDGLEMTRRGLISPGEFDLILERGSVPALFHEAWRALAAIPLSPADAALAVLRGELDAATGAAIAARSGVTAADFGILTLNTGEPPAVESLLEAQRRGFIDTGRLLRGIRQSRVRDEWSDVIERLAYAPMSTADAIEAWVQGHLSEADSRAKAQQNGLEAADWDPLAQTAGDPLSRTELETLYNRGLATRAEVEQGLRESRLKNKYIPLALDLHERLPEPRQIVTGLTHGALTKEQAARLLAEWGFSKENAAILIAEGTNARLAVHHALTLAEIRALYTEGIFTKAHAVELLAGMGYDAADTAALVSSWDLIAGAAVTRQAVGVVRNRFVARHYDENQAIAYLDSLNVPEVARQRYLKAWAIEREATVAVLTEAQIVAAHKKALISGADALARLAARGYSEGDAKILLGVKPSDPVPK